MTVASLEGIGLAGCRLPTKPELPQLFRLAVLSGAERQRAILREKKTGSPGKSLMIKAWNQGFGANEN
jgi:hypothetical protein